MLTPATLFRREVPMTRLPNCFVRAATALWRVSPPLTAVGVLMLVVLVLSLVGLVLDPRTISGMPAWLKPAKFAISAAIYSLTLAWVFMALPAWPRLRAIVGWTTAVVFVIEVAIIDAQAWRGMTSHFNIATPLDAVLFGIMGSLIVIQTVASVAVAVALWKQRAFDDAALGWALRIGMTLTIIGASTGGLMTRPTTAQLAQARVTHQMPIAGAHTVGAPDGGPGLPGAGWSREHGDLRVPHFVGLHALQVLPLVVLALRRRAMSEATRARGVIVAGGAYATFFAILLVQALRGQSVLQPDAITVAALAVWAVASAGAWLAATARRPIAMAGIL
jgi:hypothetical protein